MPKNESGKVEKVVRKVQGLRDWARPQRDVGKRGPSSHAGIAPHEKDGTTPVLIPCSPSAHAGSIKNSDYGRCSLDGRSRISTGAVLDEGKRASLEGAILILRSCRIASWNILVLSTSRYWRRKKLCSRLAPG